MSLWSLTVYGIAAALAVQGLLALLLQHRRQFLRRLQETEIQRREAEAAAQSAQEERLPGLTKSRTAAPAATKS